MEKVDAKNRFAEWIWRLFRGFSSIATQHRWFVGIWAVAFGWMLVLTSRLWGSDVHFPQILGHSIASDLPRNSDQFFFYLLLLSLGFLAISNLFGVGYLRFDVLSRKRNGVMKLTAAIAMVMILLLVLQNQHRFLPWVTQGILILGGLLLFSKHDFIRFMQLLCISIYIYSAISKFDNSFVNGIGIRLLEMPAGWLGIEESIMGWMRNLLILSFPIIELLIGIGLCIEKGRRVSVVLGMAMHVTLLLMLGPFGLQNAGSVLVWNLFFAMQLPILFHQTNTDIRIRSENQSVDTTLPKALFMESVKGFLPRQFWVRIIFLLVAILPMASRVNWIDHWSGWELYASNASYCTLKVSGEEIRELPSPIPFLMTGDEALAHPGDLKDGRLYVDIFGWSLRELKAPIYPQDRFQLAVCAAIIEKYNFRAFEVTLYSKANWWNGVREIKTVYRLDELKMLLEKFKGQTDVR